MDGPLTRSGPTEKKPIHTDEQPSKMRTSTYAENKPNYHTNTPSSINPKQWQQYTKPIITPIRKENREALFGSLAHLMETWA